MKKLMLFFVVVVFVSCSNLNSKLENSLSKEIGTPPVENKSLDSKTQMTIWKNVNLDKQNSIKNLVDKVFGALPTKKTVDEEVGEFDKNDKFICSCLKTSYIYENAKNIIELALKYEVEKHDIESLPGFFESKYTIDYTKPIVVELIVVSK